MTSPSSEPRTRSLYHALPAKQAIGLAAAAIGTIYAVQLILATAGAPALVVVAAAYTATGLGLAAYARGRPGGFAVLGVRPTTVRMVVAGLLVGSAAWYVDLALVTWLDPPGDLTPFERVIGGEPLALLVVALAVLPALVEEAVFRGLLARGLAARVGAGGAIAISAVAFAAFHLNPAQMVSTLPFGLALGVLALRGDSIVPSAVAHLANNAIVLAAQRGDLGALDRAADANPNGLLAAAIVVVVAGLALAVSAPPSGGA